ncbi:hypothetical protein GGH96_003288 [Coemansia sp. RSA 1972]|nr:hypothetical protein GGH96_003288 [Coemansia sp. RSA 1972]
MSDLDDELDRAREKSQVRFRSAFEAIFTKYGQIDEEDDIIDLSTGQLIVDNGRMRNAEPIELGDLTRPLDAMSSPRPNKRHKRQWSYSMSPELGSAYPLHNEFVDSNESDYFDAEFGTDRMHSLQWDRDSMNRAESVGYESSDSVDTGDLPLDAYFTTSIEHYLDRLRQQLAAPDPDIPDSPDTNSTNSPNISNARIFDPQRMGIYSSPRTISSDFEDRRHTNSWHRSTHVDEYVSESPSRTEERIYSREESMSEEEPVEEYEIQNNVYHSAVPPLMHSLPRPVLVKPQPVSPHVFFEGTNDPRISNHAYPSPSTNYDLAYDDDNASIHSGESIHSLPDYSAPSIPYDLQVSDNYFMQ